MRQLCVFVGAHSQDVNEDEDASFRGFLRVGRKTEGAHCGMRNRMQRGSPPDAIGLEEVAREQVRDTAPGIKERLACTQIANVGHSCHDDSDCVANPHQPTNPCPLPGTNRGSSIFLTLLHGQCQHAPVMDIMTVANFVRYSIRV